MNRFSKTSKERLATAHEELQLIFNEAIKVSPVDFGIAQGERTIKQQQQYYDEGKSKVNPKRYKTIAELLEKGKHIVDGEIRTKSEAVDIYAYYDSAARWDVKHLCFIAGIIIAVHAKLKEEGRVCRDLRWGGNWDGDGIIISDQTFQDLPHFELI